MLMACVWLVVAAVLVVRFVWGQAWHRGWASGRRDAWRDMIRLNGQMNCVAKKDVLTGPLPTPAPPLLRPIRHR